MSLFCHFYAASYPVAFRESYHRLFKWAVKKSGFFAVTFLYVI